MSSSPASEPPHLSPLRPSQMQDSILSLLELNNQIAGEKVSADVLDLKRGSSVVDYAAASSNPQTFGGRFLTDRSKVLDHNAWDHVEWDEEHLAKAAERIVFQKANPVPAEAQDQYGDEVASEHWDRFYENHEEGFFKDRKWIKLEFPELIQCTKADAGPCLVADIGCAVGNTVFPLLRDNENPELTIHALDFSAEAIKIVKGSAEYDEKHVQAAVWDMADPAGPPSQIGDCTVDVIVLIFAFSALSPEQWPIAVKNLKQMLKPGGLLLLRDYGRYDLTQLRLKANRLLSDSFYIRGDGTRVYYFTNDELSTLFSAEQGWELKQNAIDKRLLINRKEGKHMYRAWVQLKAIKS